MDEIKNLATEYLKTHDILMAKIEGLKPLLCIYRGKELYLLRKRINNYYDMACDCKIMAERLNHCNED